MKGQKKQPKVAGFMRHVLAENVKKLMTHHYRDSRNQPKALAEEAGVSLSTIQRIISGDTGASLDNIESIAAALQTSVYQLLIPELDIKNPQVVQGATKNEEKMYRQWKRSGQEEPAPRSRPADEVALRK